jgi:hypothetical protein
METITIYGTPGEATIEKYKKRLEALGRTVVIEPYPAHDTPIGLCGQLYCNCTELCKSIHHQPLAK